MSSPFPGMNPYLEQEEVWQDFHQSFLPHIGEVLSEQVRPAYFIKVEEKLYIHEIPEVERRFLGRGDLTLVGAETAGKPTDLRTTGTAIQAPAYGRLPVAIDVERHSYLEIRDRRNRELITVIEVLSPSNKKPGPDRDQYLAKRLQILSTSAHFVELDLLRGGPRLPIEDLPLCDYYAMVSRSQDRPRVEPWPIRLRERLPRIPIPLRAPDPDAHLDLQEALHRVYDGAGYDDYIYGGAPTLPLNPEEVAWARQFASGGSRVDAPRPYRTFTSQPI